MTQVFDPRDYGDSPLPILVNGRTGAGAVLDAHRCKFLSLMVTWSATTTTGTVQLETSDTPDFGGTWAPIGSAVPAVSGGAQTSVTLTATRGYVRARAIGVDGDGATVTVVCEF